MVCSSVHEARPISAVSGGHPPSCSLAVNAGASDVGVAAAAAAADAGAAAACEDAPCALLLPAAAASAAAGARMPSLAKVLMRSCAPEHALQSLGGRGGLPCCSFSGALLLAPP